MVLKLLCSQRHKLFYLFTVIPVMLNKCGAEIAKNRQWVSAQYAAGTT